MLILGVGTRNCPDWLWYRTKYLNQCISHKLYLVMLLCFL
nr:MAG TPA: hypothetical protein [Caudoviricetes sp.]